MLGLLVIFAIGQALSASDIQHVVQKNMAVKAACWADAGTNDVQLRVEIKITASGKVQSALAAGNDRGVSRCVESQIMTWVFPASDGPTTVAIPIHFVRTP